MSGETAMWRAKFEGMYAEVERLRADLERERAEKRAYFHACQDKRRELRALLNKSRIKEEEQFCLRAKAEELARHFEQMVPLERQKAKVAEGATREAQDKLAGAARLLEDAWLEVDQERQARERAEQERDISRRRTQEEIDLKSSALNVLSREIQKREAADRNQGRLEAEVDRLRKVAHDLAEVAAAVSVIAGGNWSKRQIEYLRELADEKLALYRREVEA